ncbi:MAG TPA: hypothetical protein VKM55_09420 [Candidatus Lokiarchaeia archaeon]|nr:hypothetical protein [Candidatus Lokiarchaeia archaeon]
MVKEKEKKNSSSTNKETQDSIYEKLDLNKKFPDLKGWEIASMISLKIACQVRR